MSAQIGLRAVIRKALEFVTARSTSFGEHHGIDWITYSPLQMLAYHRMAVRDAAAVVSSITDLFPEAARVADIGCGSGAYAAEWRRRGRSIVACEHAGGGRFAARLQRVPVTRFELDDDPPARIPPDRDLAYSFEVAEHCTQAQGDRLVRFLVQTAPRIVFTAAHPGQGGLGHINEQSQSYWIERFASAGAVFSPSLSGELRRRFEQNGVTAAWFSENVMVFSSSTRV